jgi:hypothetical protein
VEIIKQPSEFQGRVAGKLGLLNQVRVIAWSNNPNLIFKPNRVFNPDAVS